MSEPDRVEFRELGYKCLVLRNMMGALCGYVGVPPGHACYGLSADDLSRAGVEAHYGVSYGELAGDKGPIGHVGLESGKVEGDERWFGFAAMNYWTDIIPSGVAIERKVEEMGGPARPPGSPFGGPRTYKDLAFMMGEVRRFVRQIEDRRLIVTFPPEPPEPLPEWPEPGQPE